MSAAIKTDDASQVGEHVFERAGLGPSPYRLLGVDKMVYQACPGAPMQPGTCCQYCGTGIMYAYRLEAANGKRFHVGCDCIERAGDAGLIRAYKNSPQHRAIETERRRAVADRKAAELATLVASCHPAFDQTRPPPWPGAPIECYATFFKRVIPYCGAAGRARYLKFAKELIAKYDAGRA